MSDNNAERLEPRAKGRRASITRQNAADEMSLETEAFLAKSLPTELTDNTDDVNMNTCVCYTTYDSRILPLSVSTAPVSTTAGTNHPPLDTLQLPTSRLRCDSGNGSDIALHSSGNVSPAGSDYGGGGRLYADSDQSSSLTRTHSEDASLDTTESGSRDISTTPTIPPIQLIESTTPTNLFETADDGMMTPTVKVWPASTTLQFPPPLEPNETEATAEETGAEIYRWQLASLDHEEWVEPAVEAEHAMDSPPLEQTSSSDGNLDTEELSSPTSQTCEHSLISSPPPSVLHVVSRQLSDSSSSSYQSRVYSRPSADSLSSLDGYFSNIHYPYHVQTDHSDSYNASLSDSAFLPTSAPPTSMSSASPVSRLAGSTSDSARSPKTAAGADSVSDVKEEATTSSISSKPRKKRSLRERLSERHLVALKVDVSLKELKHPVSAPIDSDVESLFNSYSTQQPQLQSDCVSVDSVLSALHTPSTPYLEAIKDPLKRWQALKGIMPFLESYKKQKWVQLAGHQGSFEQCAEESLVLKRFCQLEHAAFTKLFNDPLRAFVPKYHGMTTKGGNQYGELENLLHGFNSPSVMDCKIGVRTYLEEELCKAEKCPTPRKDMYEKMVKIDPSEPTEEEHKMGAVSKPRYMQWREDISSTSTMGFRIEGIKCSDGKSCINFKTSKDKLTIKTIISGFLSNNVHIVKQCLHRLRQLRTTLEVSPFFASHEIIGSSLLFIHDGVKAGVWMIDFGKTTPLKEGISITHNIPWQRGNHEDGYLIGLENLITLLQTILEECIERCDSAIQQQATRKSTNSNLSLSSTLSNGNLSTDQQSLVTIKSNESNPLSTGH